MSLLDGLRGRFDRLKAFEEEYWVSLRGSCLVK